MPAKNRRRGSGFGGSLLNVPQALPEDDETPEPEPTPKPASVPSLVPAAVSPVSEPEPEPAPQERLDARVGSIKTGEDDLGVRARDVIRAEVREEPARKPPGTIRLNDPAGQALWQAYLEAKTADPFLSYRQFASTVVLDGLAADKKRRGR